VPLLQVIAHIRKLAASQGAVGAPGVQVGMVECKRSKKLCKEQFGFSSFTYPTVRLYTSRAKMLASKRGEAYTGASLLQKMGSQRKMTERDLLIALEVLDSSLRLFLPAEEEVAADAAAESAGTGQSKEGDPRGDPDAEAEAAEGAAAEGAAAEDPAVAQNQALFKQKEEEFGFPAAPSPPKEEGGGGRQHQQRGRQQHFFHH
jgi:hypothetical protein